MNRILTSLRTLAMIAFLAFALLICTIPDSDAAPGDPNKVWTKCATEDSLGCVWNAKAQGNGEGHSFIATKSGRIIFISHIRARYLLADK